MTDSSATSVDLAIVGAGAAGLATAVFAGESQPRPQSIVVLDGATTLGAKILVSGGGRCNVTHDCVEPADYVGNRHIVRNVLAALSVEQVIAWFESLGVALTREETGKLFPVSNRARTVLDALLARCRTLGVRTLASHRVAAVGRTSDGRYLIHHTKGQTVARRVVLATGGRSLPRTGSDGGGYALAIALGHTVTLTSPGLVPLVLSPIWFHAALAGLSHEVELTTMVDGTVVDCRSGSLLWTHVGVSGPVVMDASRFWTQAHTQGRHADMSMNLLGGETEERCRQWFQQQTHTHPRRTLVHVLAERIPQQLAGHLCEVIEQPRDRPCAQVPREGRARLCRTLTALPLPIDRDRGWNHAEVTAGGVPLDEIDFRTMESKRSPGLYLVGELLDCDGRIGGFNFHWAWATGYLAGRAAAGR
ncbi:MAG: aminoacetone oxidase family FAD-binding enzyme [Nitrospiraceae bacterium]